MKYPFIFLVLLCMYLVLTGIIFCVACIWSFFTVLWSFKWPIDIWEDAPWPDFKDLFKKERFQKVGILDFLFPSLNNND